MLLLNRSWMVVLAGCVGIACAACQRQAAEQKQSSKGVAIAKTATRQPGQSAAKDEDVAEPVKSKPQEPLPPPVVPKVALSDAIRAACLVNVGDVFPVAQLSDTAGKPRDLRSLFGKKLTLVCCWTTGSTPRSRAVAIAALQDLMREVAEPFTEKGVSVVGVNVGDQPAAALEALEAAGIGFPTLLDPQGDFFTKLARDRRMPRVYLLDAGGKILWFDVELSGFSRRDIAQGIQATLGEL